MSQSEENQIFTAEQVAAMVSHMNDDHADSVLLYVDAYSDVKGASAARLVSIDAAGMDIQASVDGRDVAVRIGFEKRLKTAKDAHLTLVSLLKRARRN